MKSIQKKKIDHRIAAYTFIAVIFCLILCSFIVGSIATSSGINLNDFWEGSVYSIIRYAFLIGLFYIICAQIRLKGREIPRAIDLKAEVSWRNTGFIFLIAGLTLVSFMLLIYGVSDIFAWFGYNVSADVRMSVPQYIMAIFVMCLLPAVIEELFFRGLVLKGLMPFGKVIAVVASAFLFSLFHLNPEQTVYQFILGIIFAVIVLKTGNLFYGMLLHFLNNFLVITAYTFFIDPVAKIAWNTGIIVATVGLAVVGILMIIRIANALKRHGEREQVQKTERFFSLGNIGFFVAASLAVCFWVIILLESM